MSNPSRLPTVIVDMAEALGQNSARIEALERRIRALESRSVFPCEREPRAFDVRTGYEAAPYIVDSEVGKP
jgi:hypothetical protein